MVVPFITGKVGEYYVLPLVPNSLRAKTNLTYD